MKKRINILAWPSILCLVLTVYVAKGIQGTDDPDWGENPGPKDDKLAVRRAANETGYQKIVKGLPFAGGHEKTLFFLINGKRYFQEGVTLNNQKDYSGAAEKFKEALIHLEKSNHIQSVALTHLNLAICLQTLQEREDSLRHFKEALDISRENGFDSYAATALQGSGLILNSINEKEKAIICLDEALIIHRKIYDIKGEAIDWLIKGIIESKRNPDLARSCFECALRISEEIGDPALERKIYDYLEQLRESFYKNQTREESSWTLDKL